MLLSIIIVNYNVRIFLENCLVSIQKASKGIEAEVIVVDNASDDGSIEMVKQKFPNVLLIANKENVGFAAANNQAIRKAKGKYLLLLNPDTIIQEDTLSQMVIFFEENKQAGLAGCKIINPDGTLQLACRRSFPTPWVAFTKITGLSNLFPRSIIFGKYNLTYLDPDKTYEVDAISGSFMFVRREVVEEVGLLDEQFFMYGEDLDWCYRIKKAGWKIYYVPITKVIHYKGESVRRSNIDEVKLFYEAMRLFVGKHFSRSFLPDLFLKTGIKLREWIAFLGRVTKFLLAFLLDFLLVNISLLIGEFIWFGRIFHFPSYAYPVILIVPALIVIFSMYFFGAYTRRKFSVTSTINAVALSFVILSAVTFFFKQYGFSRMVVIISGFLNFIFLPGWRIIAKMVSRSPELRRRSLFGRRTVIVGVGNSGQELLRKLRARVKDGYDVIGFIDLNRKRIGEKIIGVEILGCIDNISKVISENKVSEVIFSTDSLTYMDILTIIAKNSKSGVNFRLVPSNLEVVIGKTHIDELADVPLVDIDYNITRSTNRFVKRMFDITISLILFIFIYPYIKLREKFKFTLSKFEEKILLLPKVIKGELSLVGPIKNNKSMSTYIGKEGLTGLVQINYREELTAEEIEKYNLYYAKNQSLVLDAEILLKTIIMVIKKKYYYG